MCFIGFLTEGAVLNRIVVFLASHRKRELGSCWLGDGDSDIFTQIGVMLFGLFMTPVFYDTVMKLGRKREPVAKAEPEVPKLEVALL